MGVGLHEPTKPEVILNEFVAYSDMSNLIQLKELVNEKAILMATYALCGFANFSSIAIQIGGISPITQMALQRALIAGVVLRHLVQAKAPGWQ